MLEDAVLILSHEAERRNVEIRSEVGEGLVVTGDPEDLKEVFFNLILNGIQAMDESKRTAKRRLSVRAGPSGGVVAVRVSDTGPGISEEALPHVFEPFFTTKASGTGLGLAIVKRDVERMGGSIAVSNGGKRTESCSKCSFQEGTMRHKILVVDDEPAARYGLKRALAALSCEIVEAADGEAALDEIARSGPRSADL